MFSKNYSKNSLPLAQKILCIESKLHIFRTHNTLQLFHIYTIKQYSKNFKISSPYKGKKYPIVACIFPIVFRFRIDSIQNYRQIHSHHTILLSYLPCLSCQLRIVFHPLKIQNIQKIFIQYRVRNKIIDACKNTLLTK